MTVVLRNRPPTYQARQYDPSDPESSDASLAAWVESVTGILAAVQADAEGFSITTETDSVRTVTGVPTEWIVILNDMPTVIPDAELLLGFEVVA